MQSEMDENKLQALLQHARDYCPYYSFLPPLESGVDTSLDDYFQGIPTLSRQILQSQSSRLLSSIGDKNTWRKLQTSGRSGKPIEIILTPEAQAVEAVLFSMQVDRLLGATDWRQGRTFHLTLHVGATSRTMRSFWHDRGQVIKWNLIRVWQQTDQVFFEALKVIQGCVVTMMPSVAELLCLRIRASELPAPHPCLVLLSGETVRQEVKSLILATLKCPVSSLYTMAEVGIVASEHPDQSAYQVEEQSAIVEILDENGARMPDGEEGEIVVTPLNNLAMPLIRYRSGDRGHWIRSSAPPLLFRLVDARSARYLSTSDGRSVNTIRFAKIFASLGVDHYDIAQEKNRDVIFSYSSRGQNLNEAGHALVKTVLRGTLGPSIRIQVQKVPSPQSQDRTLPSRGLYTENQAHPEPLGPDLNILADWLRQRLQRESNIEAAVLTGSWLGPGTTTRWSDIDMVIMVRRDLDDQHWIKLSRELKSYIPRLSTNFDTLQKFSNRSPLLACRLLSEQIPLIGSIDESLLPRPSAESLCLNGLYWTQDTIAAISHRVTDIGHSSQDAIFESWLTTKRIINALRYKYLLAGDTKTATAAILNRMQTDPEIREDWKRELLRLVFISREATPPPLFDQSEYERLLLLTLSFVRLVQTHLLRLQDKV